MPKKVKRRLKKRRVLIASITLITLFLTITCLLTISINLYQYFSTHENTHLDQSLTNSEKQNTPSENTPQEKEYRLSLVMVGDSLIHDKIYNEALKYGQNKTFDFTPMLSLIKPIISTYDLAYYNQETILGGSEIGVSSYPAFNSPYEVGDAMLDAGFNLISLATNHTLDRGKQAIINSRNYWDAQTNVLAVGSYTSEESRNQPQIMEKNNITYTMLNYTYGTNGIAVPSGQEYFVNIWPVTGNNPSTDTAYQNYKEQVKKDIDAVRDNVDVLFVAMHWGIEYQTSPNAYQKDMAEYLASLDVDIIIGTHPHVVQPIEWLDDTLVIYSLGNFISAHEVINIANRIGLMSSVEIIKTEEIDGTTKIQITNLQNELLYTYYTTDYQNITVIPDSLMEEKYLTNYSQIFEEYRNIIKALDKDISIVS